MATPCPAGSQPGGGPRRPLVGTPMERRTMPTRSLPQMRPGRDQHAPAAAPPLFLTGMGPGWMGPRSRVGRRRGPPFRRGPPIVARGSRARRRSTDGLIRLDALGPFRARFEGRRAQWPQMRRRCPARASSHGRRAIRRGARRDTGRRTRPSLLRMGRETCPVRWSARLQMSRNLI